ncbi:MAG: isoamylase [Micrococcaceae bacterium]|nr:isoamylase [Micrococcaceae bacterium]
MSLREVPSSRITRPAPSRSFPLGVSTAPAGYSDDAVNLAVFAPDVDSLMVFVQPPGRMWRSTVLPDLTDGVHHGVIADLPVGSRYGLLPLAEGSSGRGVSPQTVQLLLDPYGRGIDERVGPEGCLYSSVRLEDSFDWDGDTAPLTPWRDTVLYEAHVKGLTMLHPDIPADIRGSYAALAHPALLTHLQELGVTAVELLPIHFHLDEPHLQELGLPNYWGYNTLGYFAPQVSYASAAARAAGLQAVQDELKTAIKALHGAGIEVILDVVYNHTAEGTIDRPALSWRGLADRTYYRHDGAAYDDTTGCGNTLDFSKPRVVQLALDSLRYWVEEFHIDGFRFDLAVSLSRNEANEFRPGHPFLIAAATDSTLAGVKLISEPWDLGPDGWQTGRFPPGWADWNDHFRDSIRDFWLTDQAAMRHGGHTGPLSRLADSLAGSLELFAASGRGQLSSINFITAHDGFTLRDLVSYDRKHNEDNGEQNRDGSDGNRSWNHGVEGPSENEAIEAARGLTSRNMMATLMLSLGVPMITAGDELGRTQHGNNNAYCQDNEMTWLDWTLDPAAREMLAATKRLIRVRREFLERQPRSYPAPGKGAYLHWYAANGLPMSPEQWRAPDNRVLQLRMGSAKGVLDGLIVINASLTDVDVVLPADASSERAGDTYRLQLTTASNYEKVRGTEARAGSKHRVPANSVNVFRC